MYANFLKGFLRSYNFEVYDGSTIFIVAFLSFDSQEIEMFANITDQE